MNIAILPSAFHPSLGGVEQVVRRLAHELVNRGASPVIVTNRWPRNLPAYERFEDLHLYRLPMRVPVGDWAAHRNYRLTHRLVRWKLLSILRRHRVDLINVQCVSCNAWYALHAKRKLGLPLVVTLHAELTMDPRRIYQRAEFPRAMMRATLDEADQITACSRRTLADAEAFYGRPFADRARTIYPGVNVDGIRLAAPHRNGHPYVLAVGRLVHEKGFDVLLRAFARADLRDLNLLVVGDGPDRSKLVELARSLDIEQRVQFTGHADRGRIAALFKGCEYFIIPSRADEGFPSVILEAMAAGKAVVATRVGGVPEAVLDDRTGILVDRDDVDGLTAAVARMASDEPLRQRMALAGAERVTDFTWPTITEQYEAVYREAAAASRRHPA